MSVQSKVIFLKPETSINRKLGKIKFEDAFDSVSISKAENAMLKYQADFGAEVKKEFNDLLADFLMNCQQEISPEKYLEIAEKSFSIKSRAGLGGFAVISDVADSLYKFAEKAALVLPDTGHKIVKLHLDAMIEIFANKFPKDNLQATNKLVNGLTKVALKYVG